MLTDWLLSVDINIRIADGMSYSFKSSAKLTFLLLTTKSLCNNKWWISSSYSLYFCLILRLTASKKSRLLPNTLFSLISFIVFLLNKRKSFSRTSWYEIHILYSSLYLDSNFLIVKFWCSSLWVANLSRVSCDYDFSSTMISWWSLFDKRSRKRFN